jgi:hypothetical protein
MNEDDGRALREALIREAVSLGVLAAVLWLAGPGRVLIPAWLGRLRELVRPRDPHESQVRQFAREVSEWDHEQAVPKDRPAAPGNDCGCG